MKETYCDSCNCQTECDSYERPAGSTMKVDSLWFCDFCASSHAATATWFGGQYPNAELLTDIIRVMHLLLNKLNERLDK